MQQQEQEQREQKQRGSEMQSLALRCLRLYKQWISPAFPPSCRFTPTCSEYAMEAVDRHGALRGAMMAAWRLLRCHPLAKGGFDPVPQVVPGSRSDGRIRPSAANS
jgi:putative membrane protein insertion efficiency factor